jgi:phage baseplate assembly protein W
MLGSVSTKRALTSEFLGKISRSFKDLSFNFTRNPITNDIVVLKNEESIKQSVKNLVLTQVNERPFRPLLGTNTTSFLFELGPEVAANSLIEEIERILIQNEPRIQLERIDVEAVDDTNEFEVTIEYLIVGLPPEVQNLSFILIRES